MRYQIITVGAYQVNCVILWQEGEKSAWVVDPGSNAAQILAFLTERQLEIAQIVLTHGHIDHIAALDELLVERAVPLYLHAEDAAWCFSDVNRIPPYDRVPQPPTLLRELSDGLVLEAAGLRAQVLHTPGHSPGSVGLYFAAESLLLSGDTLFAGSVGRTDLPGGDSAFLVRSLRRLAALPPATVVVAGHGPATTIARERQYNPYVRGVLRERREAQE